MDEIKTSVQNKMDKIIDKLHRDFATFRAGRANPAILDKVQIDYYGTPTPIAQLATVATPEAKQLTIQPWEANLLKDIERAILASEIGITPMNDGRIIRLNFPAPTEERRKELCREVSKHSEEAKVAVRNIRRDGIEKYKSQKKAGEITEDDLKQSEKEMQDLTDKFIKEIEKMNTDKEKEIMEI